MTSLQAADLSKLNATYFYGNDVDKRVPSFGKNALYKDALKITTQTQQVLPKVAILLCTFQGRSYLSNQLESFVSQSHTNWEVHASDDGSNDETLAVLGFFKLTLDCGRLQTHRGPGKGFSENFLSLTRNSSISADYYAYSDQDDIWEADKLERAVACLQKFSSDVPALYCSRTRLVDSKNNPIGLSPLFTKAPNFANALIQNIGGGNTMVFNNAARELLKKAGEHRDIVSHDWWAYMVISGCGGEVFYDTHPSVRYRQHGCNLVGANTTWLARITRVVLMFQGRFRNWNDRNIAALNDLRADLTLENRKIFDRFSEARNRSFFSRLIGLKRSGIYRQTLFGNLGLIAAAIFKKI